MTAIHPVSLKNVQIQDRFWTPRQRLITDVTIPYMEKILRDEIPGAEKSHAISNFRMAAGEESGEFYGMVFQDSDVAKWLEAAAYSLALCHDPKLSARVDEVVALIARAQQPDGYLNTYFTVKEPENRFKNLLECHELYCAGHMIEAGVALYEAAGKRELLDVCIRLADCITERFMNEEGIPGHQEIELALMRLYHATNCTRYRDMALRFLDLRGQDPGWFSRHTPPHPGVHYGGYDIDPDDTAYNQSDMPVRSQTAARGHAVRQMYMLIAMAEAAAAAGDDSLRGACARMFDAITQRQMYVTGAIGSSAHHESFTVDYDLPPDRCYGETCAAVAMAFFARSMLTLEPDGKYADLLELEIHNAALSGMQLDGTRFFYVNPLEADPKTAGKAPGYEHVLCERPKWYSCACCPPNLARLIASLGGYLFSEDEQTLYAHLLIGCSAQTRLADIRCESEYPWNGRAVYTIDHAHSPFRFAVHIPSHAENVRISLNGVPFPAETERGYAMIAREWQDSDTVEILFDMPPRLLRTHPLVRDTAGKAALARGPFIYCFESIDNGDLSVCTLNTSAEISVLPYDDSLLGGVVPIQTGRLRAIPYYAWSNRGENAMRVFLPDLARK